MVQGLLVREMVTGGRGLPLQQPEQHQDRRRNSLTAAEQGAPPGTGTETKEVFGRCKWDPLIPQNAAVGGSIELPRDVDAWVWREPIWRLSTVEPERWVGRLPMGRRLLCWLPLKCSWFGWSRELEERTKTLPPLTVNRSPMDEWDTGSG